MCFREPEAEGRLIQRCYRRFLRWIYAWPAMYVLHIRAGIPRSVILTVRLVRSAPAVLGYGGALSVILAAFTYTGGRLSGYQRDPTVDEVSRKEYLRKNRRRPVDQIVNELGEGRGTSLPRHLGFGRSSISMLTLLQVSPRRATSSAAQSASRRPTVLMCLSRRNRETCNICTEYTFRVHKANPHAREASRHRSCRYCGRGMLGNTATVKGYVFRSTLCCFPTANGVCLDEVPQLTGKRQEY